eukprot:TRINITY_DN5306_c3_g1_i8.p1 TRINITY_DN5306_c3_g1~~TRINITY_DN5306_c3_g1_i8.p1  ORF type:complete len:156 (-),score=3.61 TRINITY_DN5306_c3_g1_i8:136-552(-)
MGSDTKDEVVVETYTATPLANTRQTPRKVTTLPQHQILIESEVFTELNCKCMTRIAHFYNQLYRVGFLFSYFVLVLLTMIIAPLLGIIGGILEWASMVLRSVFRPVGKMVADLLGYGTTASLFNAKLERELNVQTFFI